MIGPSTVLWGILCDDGLKEGHVARLYNYLMGHNALDAAYVAFVVKGEHVERTVQGIVTAGRPTVVHVCAAFRAEVGRVLGAAGPVARFAVDGHGPPAVELETPPHGAPLPPPAVARRAVAELEANLGRPLHVPGDLLDVVSEAEMRPCQLTATGPWPAAAGPTPIASDDGPTVEPSAITMVPEGGDRG